MCSQYNDVHSLCGYENGPHTYMCFYCVYFRLTRYGTQCDWLKDDKFLKDLEGDSVDTEILEDELRSLSDDEPKT